MTHVTHVDDGTPRVSLRNSPRVRRLITCLLVGLLVAVITGPSGSVNDRTKGFTGSLAFPRVLIFLGIGLLLWALFEANDRYGRDVRSQFRRVKAPASHLLDKPRNRYAIYVVGLILALLVPQFVNSFWQQVLVDLIGIYVLLAIGLNVVVGFAGLLDLGYIAFFAIGAYITAYFTGSLPAQPPFVLNPFWIFPIAVVAAIIAGVILGAPTLRLRGDYLAIVTLGFGEIIQITANNMNGVTGGPQGVANAVPHFSVHLFGIHYQWTLENAPYYYLLVGIVVVVLITFSLLENSRVGRAWVAIREDEVAAEASGINALKYKILAFAIGASTSGFAGVLFASKIGFFDPGVFTVSASILVLVLVIFGGMGSLAGAVVGAVVLQWLPQALRSHINQQDLYIYYGALLVVMMIFRPQGIVPSRRRSRELGLAEAGVSGADALGAPGEAP
jgi:branched-chain amino acid transport system permease protein